MVTSIRAGAGISRSGIAVEAPPMRGGVRQRGPPARSAQTKGDYTVCTYAIASLRLIYMSALGFRSCDGDGSLAG